MLLDRLSPSSIVVHAHDVVVEPDALAHMPVYSGVLWVRMDEVPAGFATNPYDGVGLVANAVGYAVSDLDVSRLHVRPNDYAHIGF